MRTQSPTVLYLLRTPLLSYYLERPWPRSVARAQTGILIAPLGSGSHLAIRHEPLIL